MRLIDADALKENLKNLILPNIPEEGEEWNFDNFLSNIILKQAIEDIETAPTVDAVQVVRCVDCKHCDKRNCADGYGWCNRNGEGHGTTDDWYCADGERKDDENK